MSKKKFPVQSTKKSKGYQFKRTTPLVPNLSSHMEGPVPPTFTIKGKPMAKPKGKK